MTNIGINEYIRNCMSQGMGREAIIKECVSKFGRGRRQMRVACYKQERIVTPLPVSPIPAQILSKPKKDFPLAQVGMSKDEFMQRYSVRHIIQYALNSLQRDRLIPESEFRQIYNLKSQPNMRMYLDSKENDKYRGKAYGGPVYYSHPDTIQEMKSEFILS